MNKERSTSMTIREALVKASSLLTELGIDDGERDAELLMQHLLEWERSRLLLDWNEPFPMRRTAEWEELLRRRRIGEPLQYIIGEQEFYGLQFEVNSSVLIPRPETEILVEKMMKKGRELWNGESFSAPVIVDVGTGSGAIAVSLAALNPSWQVIACDLSPQAIEVAKRNAYRNQVGDKVSFYQGDLLQPIVERGLRIDILVSNPPYIPSTDIQELQREVKDHEPLLALDGGEDGLYYYRRLMEQMEQLPNPPRLAGFEVGLGQALEVAALMKQKGHWQLVDIVQDYAGIERHVLGWSRM